MNVAEILGWWAKNDDWLRGEMATFIVEIAIRKAFPQSSAMQDHARDVLRSAAYGRHPADKAIYGDHCPIEVYDAVAAEIKSAYRFHSLWIDLADKIPRTGMTPEQVEVFNSRAKETLERSKKG